MSAADGRPYVFDSGPLSHFAQAGWLGLLRVLVGDRQAWVPVTVLQELAEGVEAHPHLRGILEADWLKRRDLDSLGEVEAFAKYASRLLGDDQHKNLGECGVLALGDANSGIVVVDDGPARQLAAEYHVEVKTTVALLCDLVRECLLTLDLAAIVADDLLRTKYRLPFEEGGFRMFVIENDFLPYE